MSCAWTSTRVRACRSPRSARSPWACARSSTSTGCSDFPRPRARVASTCSCASSRCRASKKCAARRSRWRARWSAGCRAARRAAGRAAEPRAQGARVSLPLAPPLKPQLAISRRELPVGEDYSYEVKLDGFRCVAFVDGAEVFLQSRTGKPLGRYFPEIVPPAGRYVLDGELVVRGADGHEDFDALGQRIHPAASRIERLAVETPARYVAFDLLACEDESLLSAPFAQRRSALEELLARAEFEAAPVELIEA